MTFNGICIFSILFIFVYYTLIECDGCNLSQSCPMLASCFVLFTHIFVKAARDSFIFDPYLSLLADKALNNILKNIKSISNCLILDRVYLIGEC